MKNLFFITMAIIATTFIACTNNNRQPEGSWIIETAYGEPIIVADTAYITFESGAQRVHGCNGCNRFFGPCKIDGQSISLQNLATTMMACPDSPSETDIMKAFGETKTFAIHNDRETRKLILYNAEGDEVLTLTFTWELL